MRGAATPQPGIAVGIDMGRQVLPGDPHPLGATWDGGGVNFAIYSERATAVELCLFGNGPDAAEERLPLTQVHAHVWHAYLPGIQPGQLYGYRVHGPYEPQRGLRFNPSKLVIDPYARALSGTVDWSQPVIGFSRGLGTMDLTRDEQDDARGIPKGVVIDPAFDWEGDAPPRIPWSDSIIYEVHVKGFTKRHPGIPEELRGTYAGLAHPVAIDYLTSLGVTAVELLPVHAAVDDRHLVALGLTNYWGYNTIGYFAPDARYAATGDTGGQVRECKAMVKALHAAGIEVILDVVYNHTGEGNEFGPTLSLRGIDNTTYYRLQAGQERYYVDYTGTGNSLNVMHPQVLKLIMDSLRYWVLELHVDGFRFDLASTLARELHDVDRLAAFFDIIHQDPVLSQVKLIAEPWDVGEGGYQVGNFPVLWTEWNGKYRDAVRKFWRGDPDHIDDIASRLTGSSDLYGDDGRGPLASVNFVTAHDGFTLRDLVSYDEKHNQANGEQNRDGNPANDSYNFGVEGPTDDPAIVALRLRQMRNFLATLFFSQGVPMLCGGDELGRTQEGNNNAYCQDNEVSWYDWELDAQREQLLDFTKRLIALRKAHPGVRRRTHFRGQPVNAAGCRDITWLRPDGREMTAVDWSTGWVQSLGALICGDGLVDVDRQGRRLVDDTLLILMNASPFYPVRFALPPLAVAGDWELLLDSNDDCLPPCGRRVPDDGLVELAIRSMAVLRRIQAGDGEERAP